MVLRTIVTGANLDQLITGGPHIVEKMSKNHSNCLANMYILFIY